MSESIDVILFDMGGTLRRTVKRAMIPGARETVLALFRRGYRLGLISKTTSSVEILHTLDELRISGCFETVILSCEVGKRKPGSAILFEAMDRMGVRPERCAYIGDRPDRDVAAARSAGFGRTVLLRDPLKPDVVSTAPALVPDHFIDNLKELLIIFPARRGQKRLAADGPVYDASLSTMWGVKKFAELQDFFISARRLGFARIELNHQVEPAMLAGVDLANYRISSIHEPCPSVTSAGTLRKQDLLISSPDEERRQEGVNSIKRSIDLANELGAGTIIVHAGQVQADWSAENELHSLFESGEAETQKYLEIKESLVDLRASLIGLYLESVKKSVAELLDYAGSFNICLGIENRYHCYDIPGLDEMGEILDLAGPGQIGFWYDIGHAQILDRLGFYHYEEWLKRYAGRIVGIHLHDVVGIKDHDAPGAGEVDFARIASYLPVDAVHTLELKTSTTAEQVKRSLQYLAQKGCIQYL